MDSQKLKILLIIVLATFCAVYLGVAAATAQVEAVAWVAGVLFFVFLLALGRNVWMLIPIFSVLDGTLSFIPGYPAPWYAITPVVAFMLTGRFLMRAKNFTYRFTWLDILMLLQILVLVQAYVRNPTGLAILGNSAMVGGRPYMDYAVAIFCYFVLATVKTELRIVKQVIVAMIIVSVCDKLLMGATSFSGSLSQAVGKIYTNVDYAANEAGSNYTFDFETTRFTSLSGLGMVIAQLLFSFNRPLECLLPLRPFRFLALLLSLGVTLLSGYRSGLIKMACFFVGGTVIRRKVLDLFMGGAAAVALLALVLGAMGGTQLPFAVQRALSFLPIGIDESIRAEAVGSTEWRHEMWRLVLTSDRYIHNKVLGDGFGFSAAEQQAQQDDALGIRKYQGDSIDAFIAKGSYHGWHVEAIRFTGAVGLVIGVFILFGFARAAWVTINHHRGTDFYDFAIFLGLPFLIEPFYTLFVFGSYKGSFIAYIAAAGALRVLYGLYLADQRHPASAREATPIRFGPGIRGLRESRPAFANRR